MQDFCTAVNSKLCIARNPLAVQDSYMARKAQKKAVSAGELTAKQRIGRNLRITIAAVGLKPADAAREMDISPSKLGNWLRGDNYPDPLMVTRFCADHAAPLEMVYSGTAAYAHPALASAYAIARRQFEAGELND